MTFNGLPAQLLFINDTQINLIVPAGLGTKTSAQLIVTVDGTASAPLTVSLTPFAPGIFANGVLNQDYSLNSAKQPAALGSVIQVFATGLSGTGVITAKIGTEAIDATLLRRPGPRTRGRAASGSDRAVEPDRQRCQRICLRWAVGRAGGVQPADRSRDRAVTR